MTIKLIKLIFSVAVIISLLIGGSLLFGGQQITAAEGEELDTSRIERPEKGDPKLDSQLNQLVSANTTKRVAALAEESNIKLVDDNVRVIIECLPDQIEDATEVADDSGIVEASYENLIQVVVPISQLTTLADAPSIRLVRLPREPLPDVVSEGVALINADDWQTASFNGTGVKVGILDGGFSGYTTRQSEGELPPTVTTWWAPSIGNAGTSIHGTACAEIVHDVATDADFYLANFGTEVEKGNAVNWFITQGVDIISCSMSDPIGGPGDGTGTSCEIVDNAHAAGILWSQSAGNYAERHWQGDFADTDVPSDGCHNFSGADETIDISVTNGDTIVVGLRWVDTWGSSGNDYDLYLVDNTPTIVDWSTWTQDGNDDPWEQLSYTATYTGTYHIVIDGLYASQIANLEIFCYYHDLQEYQVASHSLSVPADSANALSVGAIDYSTPTTLESFSSRGPTTDSRIKPDLVAPDGVSTSTYGATAFYGTSASAPHVAGAAALVKECYPIYTNAQIKSFLEGRAVDLGAGGKDNLYGSGRLDLGSITLPTMEAIAEAEGGYYNTAPVLSNFGFDDDADLDDGWYQMDSYTGSWTSLFTDVSGTEWNNDSWTIPGFAGLGEGSHTIYFKASDDVGNLDGESGEWSWQFYKDTVAPADPTSVNSTSHTVSTWSSDNTVDIGWIDATDATSGLDGYSVLWDTNTSTIPDQNKDIEEGVQSANSTALADGSSHYFHIRSVDNAGNWQSTVHVGPFYIETVPPTDPTGVSSPSHTVSTWSSDNTVDISWTDATDATSGLDGYSVLWDTNTSTIPDQNKDIEEGVQSANSTALADGNSNYFHIRSVDNAGNWQSTVHVGPFFIDANPPADPTSFSSTSHTVSTWSSDNTVDIGWIDATDSGSGLDGYSILWSENATSMPDQTKDIEEGVQSANSTELVDGNSHYFHIISADNFGNWQSTVHYGPFYIAVNCPILSEGTVNPTSGYTSASFTYSVNYTDFEDDTPDSIKISIDSGASVNMTARAGQDGDFTNGEIYEYITSGGTLGTGSHTFQFFANDGTDDAIGDIDVNNGPTVSKAAAAGGGGGGGGAPPPGVTKVIDVMSSKGEFKENVTCKSEDECVELYIPENTIAKRITGGPIYTIKIIESEDPPPAPEQTNLIGLVYDFSPEGITFEPAVDLTIKYDESLMTEGVSENSLIIAIWDSDAGKWVELEGTVDPENNTVTIKISHFTEYTILVHTTPASFTGTNLSIVPKEIDLGESATVSVTVTNTGDLSGEYELYLKTDDVISQTKEITLTGGSSQQVTFSVAKDVVGECCVDINGLTGSFVINEEAPVVEEEIEPTPKPAAIPVPETIPTPQPPFNWGFLVGILAGVAAIGSATYYVVRKRMKAKGSG